MAKKSFAGCRCFLGLANVGLQRHVVGCGGPLTVRWCNPSKVLPLNSKHEICKCGSAQVVYN